MGNKFVEFLSNLTTTSKEVLPDIFTMNFRIVTASFIGNPKEKNFKWVLVDTGLENSADYIISCAKRRFGENSRPEAIVLTHGHFDHVGSVIKLSEYWNTDVYIHKLEIPYLRGEKDYPLGDATVDKGFVAKMSPSFPHTSIDIDNKVKELPEDGSIPSMPDWKWIHTPGHSDGHVSLFREKDRTLIAGDVISTTKQESLFSVITQKDEISGPPKYLTTNWINAKKSVETIRNLNPALIIPSHGEPIKGGQVTEHLNYLLTNFARIAKPHSDNRLFKD